MGQQKQLQAERQIAELQLTISKLENSLREASKTTPRATGASEQSSQDEELQQQIQMLSDEVVRLRDKVANQNRYDRITCFSRRFERALSQLSLMVLFPKQQRIVGHEAQAEISSGQSQQA